MILSTKYFWLLNLVLVNNQIMITAQLKHCSSSFSILQLLVLVSQLRRFTALVVTSWFVPPSHFCSSEICFCCSGFFQSDSPIVLTCSVSVSQDNYCLSPTFLLLSCTFCPGFVPQLVSLWLCEFDIWVILVLDIGFDFGSLMLDFGLGREGCVDLGRGTHSTPLKNSSNLAQLSLLPVIHWYLSLILSHTYPLSLCLLVQRLTEPCQWKWEHIAS